MKNGFLPALVFNALVNLTGSAQAASMPAETLQPVFEKLTDERPVWMSEAPDGSGRFFVVYALMQDGKILHITAP